MILYNNLDSNALIPALKTLKKELGSLFKICILIANKKSF